MATPNKLVSMAKQFSGLPMKELIGAPLVAASEANNMMAMSQTKFLLETCFELIQLEDREIHKPIMINMTVARPVINADGSHADVIETDFNLPLLTIIPINSLAVDELKFSFEMEVKSSYSAQDTANKSHDKNQENGISKTLNKGAISAELTGAVASTDKSASNEQSNYKKSNAAKYEINAHAGPLPLPVGITTIIETYSQAIAPIQVKGDRQ
ncbi:DUF2589 domain-containing protein [Thalassotalea sp. LPB0316]|uniref:DUF2589 domain-containing protein n=1 Tax=Thalassotalea sp. LPB0316 TaxID=2769490 RepID=UPI001867EAEB|nr:DUF2589 domain-containing protein [Thalassotalea sp. LPB0316]QOL25218.1 DUF2589 domain-containing protein [Thalassotalea sp. LPB0316]